MTETPTEVQERQHYFEQLIRRGLRQMPIRERLVSCDLADTVTNLDGLILPIQPPAEREFDGYDEFDPDNVPDDFDDEEDDEDDDPDPYNENYPSDEENEYPDDDDIDWDDDEDEQPLFDDEPDYDDDATDPDYLDDLRIAEAEAESSYRG